MKVALAIYRMKPGGGIEDQCLRLAREMLGRGHQVEILTTVPDEAAGVPAILLPTPRHLSNHARMAGFARLVSERVRQNPVDRLVSFQPVPGADFYFCGDRIRNRADLSRVRRWTPRFRTYARLEEACFSPRSSTVMIGLACPQIQEYRERYGTPPERLVLLPPSIDLALRVPERQAQREGLRTSFGIAPGRTAWLWLGLQPEIKGLDRVIEALSHFPQAELFIGGLSEDDSKSAPYKRIATRLDVALRLHWLGYLKREAKLDAIAASDLLVHPARTEVTGGVILEALINGLPVVTTANCGFAEHVERAGAGQVIAHPFQPEALHAALAWAGGDANRALSARGIAYGASASLYEGISVAADLVEAGVQGVGAMQAHRPE